MTKKDKNEPMIFRRKKSKERKVSEMVLNFAGDYIAMGDDIEDKQQYLNGAVSAWNIACLG
jgi:glycerol-3-phosphate cytidylyltransferase-like family protein